MDNTNSSQQIHPINASNQSDSTSPPPINAITTNNPSNSLSPPPPLIREDDKLQHGMCLISTP